MTGTASKTPLRTCVGCRTRRPQPELLRFRRRPDGRAVPALGRGDSGRGAYLCPSRACFDAAMRRRTLTRALAGPRGLAVSCDPISLWSAVNEQLSREVDALRRSASGRTSKRRNALAWLHGQLAEPGRVPNGEDSRV